MSDREETSTTVEVFREEKDQDVQARRGVFILRRYISLIISIIIVRQNAREKYPVPPFFT
jgi:hypothetical protein